jgi:hypothetical protein
MDKVRRKEILQQVAENNLADFRKGLPIDENIFPRLFDFLDVELGENNCNHTTVLTREFLDSIGVKNTTAVIEWLADNGGYCDCEILANVEDQFQYLHPPISKPISKTQIKKQKLNSLKTDYGFCIDKVPSPWVLTETILSDKSLYNFQIGKGIDCIVSIETSFSTDQFSNDQYWLDLWINETELNYKLEDLTVERTEIDNYSCLIVKSKDWIPVFYWFKSKLTDKWFLRMKTGSARHKGDFKEFIKLLNYIQVDGQ